MHPRLRRKFLAPSDTKSTSTESIESAEGSVRSNFIRDIIDADNQTGVYAGRVVTRFPPEPNGYLHIGHAKSICLNFGIGRDYKSVCHLRFDDTNPEKEETEYVESIKEDVKWLGFDWGENLYFASDYFEQMYQYAEKLIRDGKAYVDSSSKEEIREHRGSLTEPGQESPYRNRSVEENLDLFRRMRAGEFEDGAHVLRARIDMASPNMLMRDPLLYRIRHMTHHRTGDDWCIYPMYDYAHCLEDAIEDITHSICTLEFENNRALYDWVLENVETPSRPKQIEFARLNLGYTIMSKRKLLQLVQDGIVEGWNDPRMPTISGMRRRGVRPEAIRAFCDMIGVAKGNSTVDIDKLEYCIRDDLNPRVPRVLCVLDPLKVVITNYPEEKVEWMEASYYPHDVPLEGSRKVPFAREIYIERSDFSMDPPKGWYRLAPGREVRLRYGYCIQCTDVVTDPETGDITEIHCTYDPDTQGGVTAGRKVKGTLHWVAAETALQAEVRVYDRLFQVEKPDADPDVDFRDNLNPDSLITLTGCLIEPGVASDPAGTRYQFERTGYFCSDVVDSSPDRLVFNRIVTLRDSWAKSQTTKEEAPVQKAPAKRRRKPQAKGREDLRAKARERDPELATRYARYTAELGLTEANADRLTGDRGLSDFFEAALGAHNDQRAVAKWVVNEFLRVAKDEDVGSLAFNGADFGALVKLVDTGVITSAGGKQVFEEMQRSGDAPQAIVDRLGLAQTTDTDAIAAYVDAVLGRCPDEVARYQAGETKLLGLFMGQVMRESKGTANPKDVRQLLAEKLDG
ncbi:MAG: glutamine--tRNA ligase [Myxococcales bacterium]|nr:glutamine--tRNA ligase [Myxococcales bacterium]